MSQCCISVKPNYFGLLLIVGFGLMGYIFIMDTTPMVPHIADHNAQMPSEKQFQPGSSLDATTPSLETAITGSPTFTTDSVYENTEQDVLENT